MNKITLIVSYVAIVILVAVAGVLLVFDNNAVKDHEIAYAKNQKELKEYDKLCEEALNEREAENARIRKVNAQREELARVLKDYIAEAEAEAANEDAVAGDLLPEENATEGAEPGTDLTGAETLPVTGDAPATGETPLAGETPVGTDTVPQAN